MDHWRGGREKEFRSVAIREIQLTLNVHLQPRSLRCGSRIVGIITQFADIRYEGSLAVDRFE